MRSRTGDARLTSATMLGATGWRPLPRTAVALDTYANDRRVRGQHKRRIFALGVFSAALRNELIERGAGLTDLPDPSDGFFALAEQAFDAALINPTVTGTGTNFIHA